MVCTLLDEQLRPLGVVAAADGSSPEIEKADSLLELKFRTKVVPARLVRVLTSIFKPLFLAPVVALVVAAFVALDVWLFGIHGVGQGLRSVIYDPALMFMVLGGVVLATAFHEIGHATGVRYGGAEPGVMGVGVYIVWPAFYTDITDSYRLGKAGRLRADLGGMYFNMVFALCTTALYAATRFEPLLLLVLLQTFAIVQQSLPLLRLDGFYIISDLTGVPDMLGRIRPILRSVRPGREPDPRVTELKPWVRRVVTGYVLTVVPLIALLFVVMIAHAPRAFATAYDSFVVHLDRIGPEFSDGETLKGIKDGLEMLVLALPLIGMLYTTSRVGARAFRGARTWSADSPSSRATVLVATAAAAGAIAFVWWPNGDYRPIQPGEKGTLIGAIRDLRSLPSGRPGLTPQRERELGGAPFRRDTETTTESESTPARRRTATVSGRRAARSAPPALRPAPKPRPRSRRRQPLRRRKPLRPRRRRSRPRRKPSQPRRRSQRHDPGSPPPHPPRSARGVRRPRRARCRRRRHLRPGDQHQGRDEPLQVRLRGPQDHERGRRRDQHRLRLQQLHRLAVPSPSPSRSSS